MIALLLTIAFLASVVLVCLLIGGRREVEPAIDHGPVIDQIESELAAKEFVVTSDSRGELGRFFHVHEAIEFAERSLACEVSGGRIWTRGPKFMSLWTRP